MNKQFETLDTEVRKIEAELNQETKRLSETKKRLRTQKDEMDGLWERYKETVIKEEDRGIQSVEKEFNERKTLYKRDEALKAALEGKILTLENELTEKKKQRNGVFCELAKTFLKREIAIYDANARKVITSIQRFLSCHNLLREIDSAETYKEVVGCYEFLSSVKIPIIKGFDKSDFISGRGICTTCEEREKVFNEIINGK